jgi:hypothetical protein
MYILAAFKTALQPNSGTETATVRFSAKATDFSVRFEAFTVVTMKSVAFWEKIRSYLTGRHITSPVHSPAG